MSKISIYDVVPVPKLADKLVGTSVGGAPEDLTYNFTLGELLNLFIPNIPGNTLQGVLDFGNTATQNINLTGTVNTTNLTVSATANILNSNLTGQTKITGGLFDRLNSIGTAGQVLTSTGTQVEWYTIPTIIPNLQQVLTAGNTAANNIILTGNLTANNAALLTSTISTSLTLLGTLKDGLSSVGAINQVLSSNGTGVRWVNLPVYSAASPLLYNSGTGVFSIQQANASQSGYLSSADWITFDGKQTAISLTTTGSSGPSTLVGATINVPNYTLSGLGGVPQTRTLTINGVTYNLSADRSWTIAAGVSSVTASSPLFSTGGATPNITIQQSSSSLDGYLSSVDWLTFNSKQAFLGGTGLVKSVAGTISYITDNSANWNTAYNDSIVSAAVTGTATKLLTLNQQDGGTITASWSDIDTGLTSVGVSMPAAFTVTNSPLTSNGTIAITGSGNTLQYIDGTGALQTFPSLTGFVPYTGATGSVNLGAYSLTATSLIKNGGTSGQFLKADGSVDSSAYIVLGSLSASAPLSYNNLTGAFSITQSGTVTDGYLSSTDWNTFNSKQGALTLTTTGSSGASTLIGNTLNIPQYTDQFVGTVTSVGLSMPSAFSVSNSPVTSSGTLTVVGAGLASQYVRGDGTLADFPSSGGGGGSSVSYYLNGSVSQGTIGGVAYRELSKVPILGAGTDISINANGYIASFITDAGDPNLLEIPAGNWNFETYFSASSVGGSPTFYVELYKYNGVTFTLIASNSATPELIAFGTNIQPYFSALAVPQTTLLATDRLAVRYYVVHSGRTITLHTENGHLCQIITTFTTGLTALNGLTTQVQYFSTGTSGADFNISSAVATHTFNLPTASAVNRGALSSADWTTFDNKQPAGNYVTTDTTQTITALKTILRGGDVLNFKIGVDTLYGLKIAYNQNELVPSGEATWSFVNTFNRDGTGFSVTPLSFFRGVLVTGERLLSASVNSNLLDYYGNNPSGRYPIYAYNTGVQQFQDSILVGFNTGVVNAATGAIASLPAGVVANFNGRVIGSNAVNSNEFATLGQLTGGTVTSVGLTSVTSGVTIGSTPITTSGNITIAIATATASQNGLLSSTDWTTFNSKQGAITLTTTGSSGASTLVGNTLNIPNYTDSFVGTVTSVSFTLGTTGTDLSSSVANSTTTPAITLNVPTASASARGALSAADWTTFNNKQGTITLTTTGTSGAATFSSNTLNIPDYGSALSGYLPLTGGTLTGPLFGTTASFSGIITTTSTSIASGNLGGNVSSYSGNAQYPTLFGSAADRWVMHINPHISYTENGVNGFTGSMTGATIRFASNPAAASYWDIGIGTNGAGADKLSIGRAGSNFLSITNVGNVGIGTLTAGQKLQIGSGSETGNHYLRIFGAASDIYFGQTGSNLFGAGNGQVLVTDSTYTGPLAIGTLSGNANATLIFGTGNTERARITSGGNLLVGTTTDNGAKLQVSGGNVTITNSGDVFSTIKTTSNSGVASYLCQNDINTTTEIGNWGSARSGFGAIQPNNGYIFSGDELAIGASLALKFGVGGSNTERMRITSSGNVGIGTTSPASRLQVDSAGYSLIAGSDAGNRRVYIGLESTGEPSIQGTLSNGTARQLSINPSGGNVLIGTTTDNGSKLQVSGAATVSGAYGTASGVYLSGTTYGTYGANRGASSASAGMGYFSVGSQKWFAGIYENSDNFGFYSVGTNGFPLILNYSTGAATFSSSVTAADVYAKQPTGGYISLRNGGAGAAGYMEIYSNNGITRLGYIGYNTTNITYVAENSAIHSFTGAATFLSSVTASGQITGPSGGTEGKFNFIGYNNAYGGITANTGFNTNYNAVSIYSNFNSARNGQGNTSNPSWILDLGGSIPDPDSFSIFRSPAGSFTFSNLFKITSSGNVGIETANPITRISIRNYSGARLPYINGTANTFDNQGITVASANSGNAAIGGGLDLTNNTYSVGAYSPVISFSSLGVNSAYNNSYAGIWGILGGPGGDANWVVGSLAFGTASAYGISERMRIANDGNVLIGTTSNNGSKLQVNGNISAGNISAVTNTIGTVDMGLSGGGYATLGYNISYTSTSNTYQYKVGDTSWMADFGNANLFRVRYAPSGTAGNTISYSNLLTINTSGAATFLNSVKASNFAFNAFSGGGEWQIGSDAATGSGLYFYQTTYGYSAIIGSSGNATFASSVTTSRFFNPSGPYGTGQANARNHFTQFNAGNATLAGGWIAGAFGDALGNRIVIGQYQGVAVIAGHNGNLDNWASMALATGGGNVLIGTITDSGDKLRVNGTTFTNDIMTWNPQNDNRSGVAWRLGAATIGTDILNRRLRVNVGGVEYYIGAVEV